MLAQLILIFFLSILALTNVCSKKPVLVTNLTSSRHDRIVTNSSNQLCKANTSSQQLQLINLNKTTKSSCSPIKTINLMSQHCQTKSNLLTIVDKVDEYHEDTFLSKLSETESASSNMLDDSLTSLQWLQSLNIMKSTSIEASSCSLSPNSQTSDKFQPSLDCDLDSATIPAAASVSKTADSSLKSSLSASYCQPLSPPLSVQCSASPQSTCSSNASTKRRSKKNEPKTVQQQLQHQMSAPAILQPNKSQASNSASSSVVRNSFLKDRDEYRTNSDVKPPYSYSQLIILSMKESKQPKMTLQMIYDWIIGNFSYFKKADPNWQVTFKNSIRHNLSLNKCFRKIARQKDEPGKGGFWMLDPVFEQQLDQSSSLGLVNGKNYKRKRKICDDNDDKKKPKLDLVQFNELENCDFVKSDANLSQINKSHSYTSYSIVSNGCADNPAHYIDSQLAHVHHQQQANNQPDQQHQLQSQQASNAAHFDFGDSFNGSFASNGISYIKNFDDESSLFNFDPNLPSLDLDHFTDSSCTSNSSPDDLVSGLLKKSANLAHDNELSELFDITSQFNLDENFNSTNLINPSSEKKSIDLTVQGTGIRQPKWWPDSLLDIDDGHISVQSHIIQDDECDSAAFIADSHNSLDFGLNVDDLDWTLSLGHFKDSPGSQQIQQSQQQQQHHHHHQQHARKRFYTHQTKQNPAIHKVTKAKQAY